jgi:thiamine phosphate synthase YjbQ (UPF0047 family)
METLSSVKLEAERKDMPEVRKSSEVTFFTKVLNFVSQKRIELHNITADISALVKKSGIRDGILNVSSLHTTTALFINEYQSALLEDIKSFLERLLGENTTHQHQCDKHAAFNYGYKHNCEYCSDCDRKNADAHLGATMLGHNLCLQIADGQLVLGKWQSIIFAELDGPKARTLVTQIIGS